MATCSQIAVADRNRSAGASCRMVAAAAVAEGSQSSAASWFLLVEHTVAVGVYRSDSGPVVLGSLSFVVGEVVVRNLMVAVVGNPVRKPPFVVLRS